MPPPPPPPLSLCLSLFLSLAACQVSKRYGDAGLPDDTIRVKLHGHAGQSMAFALAKGVTIDIAGDANDYAGKGLSGGKLIVSPERDLCTAWAEPAADAAGAAGGSGGAGSLVGEVRTNAAGFFTPEEHVVCGNACLYGATGGAAFFRGKAGERFAVRNSGALAVVEGVGDHGCEYMTGGTVMILGETGNNFASGMSGGVAFVHDPALRLPARTNYDMVELEPADEWYDTDPEVLRGALQQHVAATGSTVAHDLLARIEAEGEAAVLREFVKVMPQDYKRVLEERRRSGEAPSVAMG